MPSYKLVYFNGRGRAEGIRILFKLAGVDFEDYRIAGHEEWEVYKASIPISSLREYAQGAVFVNIATCETCHVVPRAYEFSVKPGLCLRNESYMLGKFGEISHPKRVDGDINYDYPVVVNTQKNTSKEKSEEATFGTVPILEVDGKKLCQSKAIYRYLAREFGYYAENNWDCAEVDCVIDMMEDFHTSATSDLLSMKDGEEKQKARMEYKKYACKILGDLEKKLKENDGGDSFFVGHKMTVADILLYTEFDFLPAIIGEKDFLQDYPKLNALRNRVGQKEKIAAWVEIRPDAVA